MNSTVVLRDMDTKEKETYTLVFPDSADIAHDRLSVLAPVGTAILGQHVGDIIRWRVPQGLRRLKVETVVYQPEREGLPRLTRSIQFLRVSLLSSIGECDDTSTCGTTHRPTSRNVVAADVMTRNPKSIRQSASVRDTAGFLTSNGIHTAPVIDEAGLDRLA